MIQLPNINDRLKYIAITTITFLTLVFIISASYYRIIYTVDSVRSFFLNLTNHSSSMEFTDDASVKRMQFRKRTFSDLPAGYIHCGPFLLYRAATDISTDTIARDIISYTSYYRLINLKRAIKKFNSASRTVKGGQSLIIPGALPSYIAETKNFRKPELINARGIYLTGISAGNPSLLQKIPYLKQIGINTIVFDVKDIPGILNYRSRNPLAVKYNTHEKAAIDNVDLFIRSVKSQGMYVIARIAVFRDHLLIKRNPSLAIKSRRTGGIWNHGSKEIWCDPSNKTVQEYNISLALEMASRGVDEIQFDYIRFPTVGDQKDAVYAFDFGKMSKDRVIADFLKRAHERISAANARLSIDIFGVVAWGKSVDINKTGQRIEYLSQYCDYISPMLYPSHFDNNFDGYKNPADHPYYFINEGNKKVIERLANNKVIIRPWLQAFHWKVSSYDPQYIIKQIQASNDSGAKGYLFWNASNDYRHVYSAMESISKKGAAN